MVIYHLEAGGGCESPQPCLCSPELHLLPCQALCSPLCFFGMCLIWGHWQVPTSSQGRKQFLGQSKVSFRGWWRLVQNVGCYLEKLLGAYLSQVWTSSPCMIALIPCLEINIWLDLFFPAIVKIEKRDWIGSKLSTATGRNENQRQTQGNSSIHFTDAHCVSSCAGDCSVKWKCLSFSCAQLCDSMACRPPGSSVCGFLHARMGVGSHFLLQGIFPT